MLSKFGKSLVRHGLLTLVVGSLWAAPGAAWAEVKVGAELSKATIRDGDDASAEIPGLGERVLLVLYTDPDVADQNDAFADAVKAENLDRSRFQSVGVANMKDAPAKPNWIIRSIVRGKVKKYKVTILTDPDRSLIAQWDLGDCNNKSVALIIGKDKKLKYIKKGQLSADEIKSTVELLKKVISES